MTQTIENFPGLFSTKSEFLAFKQAWKALAHKKSLTKEDVLLRMVLLGKPVLSALPYPTNKVKLENGGISSSGVTLALNMFQAYREKSTTSQNFAAKWAVSLSPQTYAKALERIREKGGTSVTDYVYVVVRKDLELEHQQVQACHAAWEAGRYSFHTPNEKPNLVLLGVADESELVEHSDRLRSLGIENWLYHEPDDNAGHTAFACRPVSCPNERKLFRKLKLLVS